MNINILKNYMNIKSEIKGIEKQLEELKRKRKVMVMDSVKSSCSEFPYTEHRQKIIGVEINPRRNKQIRNLEIKLKMFKEELEAQKIEVELYIESIEISSVRQIMRYRVVRGMGWKEVATEMGRPDAVESYRKEYSRFIEKTLGKS